MRLMDLKSSNDHRFARGVAASSVCSLLESGSSRRLNLVFLTILLAAVALLGGGMHLVHGVQVRRNASALLDRAGRAEAGNDLEKAEQSLSQYLKSGARTDPHGSGTRGSSISGTRIAVAANGSSWSTSKPFDITPTTPSSNAGVPISPWSWAVQRRPAPPDEPARAGDKDSQASPRLRSWRRWRTCWASATGD